MFSTRNRLERYDREKAHDIKQGIEIKLLMHPKLTEIPHNLALPTILSLIPTSPVSKESTAPGPLAIRS